VNKANVLRRLRAFGRDAGGASAVEFVLWLALLAYPLINVFDLGLYVYQRMQVENAAQMGVQASYTTCSQAYPSPSFTNCGSTGTAAVTTGTQSASLTTANITVATGEYVNNVKQTGSGTLTATPPSSTGDYVAVQVSYPYAPLFRLATVTALLSNPIVRTHWMRMS
jgi:Flp pilus assembly protein TadG